MVLVAIGPKKALRLAIEYPSVYLTPLLTPFTFGPVNLRNDGSGCCKKERLCGSDGILKPIKSSHTHRTLKPYIRQDFETEPSKLKLIREINQRTSKEPIPKFPINYTYIQAKHVGQINRLATAFFWPGIDGTFRALRYGPYFNNVSTFLAYFCPTKYPY